ncbi:hypothetical protein D3C86_1966720 [compost metagenome]
MHRPRTARLHIRTIHRVAPRFLGAVKRLVGTVHQLFKVKPRAFVQRGHADADGDRNAGAFFVDGHAHGGHFAAQ